MKHSGKARTAAFKLILFSLIAVVVILAIGIFAAFAGAALISMIPFLIILWALFAVFTLFFFRDPDAQPPTGANLVLSPAHGRVDVIGMTTEREFMGGECQRISMFLSVMDVHVQNAPVGGKVAYFKYTMGDFINAMKAESAVHNENVLLGFETNEPRGQKVGIRLIAGVLARRIVPWVQLGDEVARGERISLIQFGSRADIYLPAEAKIKIKIGERLVGGETVVAVFE